MLRYLLEMLPVYAVDTSPLISQAGQSHGFWHKLNRIHLNQHVKQEQRSRGSRVIMPRGVFLKDMENGQFTSQNKGKSSSDYGWIPESDKLVCQPERAMYRKGAI